MKNALVVLGVILLCIILVLINSKTEQYDDFTNEIVQITAKSRSGVDDPIIRGIVPPNDMHNNYSVKSLKVIDTVVSDNASNPSNIFNETKIVRPLEVQNGLDTRSNNNKVEYNKVNNAVNNFKLPALPNDLITSRKYNDLSKWEVENRSINDIYNMMVDKVVEHVDKSELDRIQGSYMDNYNSVSNLYNPEYTSYQAVDFNKDIEYKYKPYDGNLLRAL